MRTFCTCSKFKSEMNFLLKQVTRQFWGANTWINWKWPPTSFGTSNQKAKVTFKCSSELCREQPTIASQTLGFVHKLEVNCQNLILGSDYTRLKILAESDSLWHHKSKTRDLEVTRSLGVVFHYRCRGRDSIAFEWKFVVAVNIRATPLPTPILPLSLLPSVQMIGISWSFCLLQNPSHHNVHS